MHGKMIGSLVAVMTLVGCAEVRMPDDTGSGADTSQSDASQSDVTGHDTQVADVATGDAGLGHVVINEMRASGEDWIELYNGGTTSVDLSNFGVTDTQDGGPRVGGAVRFPAGTILLPGAYILVVGGYADAAAGVMSNCLDGGSAPCVQATWSISATRGETVWIVSASDQVVEQAMYPAAAVPSGQSLGRLPNGTGAFAPNQPTPGVANLAP